jgi:type I restriction enzyme R subunit
VLAAFRQYHTTAQLADVSDPNVVLDRRGKLDAAGVSTTASRSSGW